MKVLIPKVILYRRKPGEPKEEPIVRLSDGRGARCLFSCESCAVEFRENSPTLVPGWELGPMDDEQFRRFLDSLNDQDLIALDPRGASDKEYYCITVSELRDIVASGEKQAGFKLYAAAKHSRAN